MQRKACWKLVEVRGGGFDHRKARCKLVELRGVVLTIVKPVGDLQRIGESVLSN